MSDNNRKAIGGPNKDLEHINQLTERFAKFQDAHPASQQSPAREATARRVRQPSQPQSSTRALGSSSAATASPASTPAAASTTNPLLVNQSTTGHTGGVQVATEERKRRWPLVVGGLVITGLIAALVTSLVSNADTDGGGNGGDDGLGKFPATDTADANVTKPVVCTRITYAAYDPSIKGTNAMGPPQHFATADEGRDRLFQKAVCEPLYLAVIHEFFKRGADLPENPEADPEIIRLANLYTSNAEEWKKGYLEVLAMIPNKDDAFVLKDAGKTRYESQGFIPDASGNSSVMPTLTLWGQNPELGWVLVVNTKYGPRVLRIYCDLQPSVQKFAPPTVTSIPPSNPPLVTVSTPPPVGPPPVGPPPVGPPPVGPPPTCEEVHGPNSPECNPCPPQQCNQCPPGECKTNHVPSDPGMPLAPQDRFEPTPQVPAQPYTPDIRPGAPSDPNPASPGGVYALPPGQSQSTKPVQEQKPDVNRPVDNPAANAPVNGATTGGNVGGPGATDPEGSN